MAFTGTIAMNFGNAPAMETMATATVTGQTTITGTSKIEAWIMPTDKADPNGHSENEHMVENLKVSVPTSTITPGVGFVINGECQLGTTNGQFVIQWVWN